MGGARGNQGMGQNGRNMNNMNMNANQNRQINVRTTLEVGFRYKCAAGDHGAVKARRTP